MLTAEEFAAAISTPYPTVALWLRQGRIKDAERLEVGKLRFWQIPAAIVQGFVKPTRGRPEGSKDSKKRAKRKPATKKSRKTGN